MTTVLGYRPRLRRGFARRGFRFAGRRHKVVVAAPCRCDVRASGVAEDELAGRPGDDLADAGQWQPEFGRQSGDRVGRGRRRGEKQFVVVAAGQQAIALESRIRAVEESAGGRQPPTARGCGRDRPAGRRRHRWRLLPMPRRARPSATRGCGRCSAARQSASRGWPRIDASLQVGQPQCGAARAARYPDRIAGSCAERRRRLPGGDFAEDGDAEVARPARGVAADQVDAEFVGAGEEAAGEIIDPVD